MVAGVAGQLRHAGHAQLVAAPAAGGAAHGAAPSLGQARWRKPLLASRRRCCPRCSSCQRSLGVGVGSDFGLLLAQLGGPLALTRAEEPARWAEAAAAAAARLRLRRCRQARSHAAVRRPAGTAAGTGSTGSTGSSNTPGLAVQQTGGGGTLPPAAMPPARACAARPESRGLRGVRGHSPGIAGVAVAGIGCRKRGQREEEDHAHGGGGGCLWAV